MFHFDLDFGSLLASVGSFRPSTPPPPPLPKSQSCYPLPIFFRTSLFVSIYVEHVYSATTISDCWKGIEQMLRSRTSPTTSSFIVWRPEYVRCYRHVHIPLYLPVPRWEFSFSNRFAQDLSSVGVWSDSEGCCCRFPSESRFAIHGRCCCILTFRRRN